MSYVDCGSLQNYATRFSQKNNNKYTLGGGVLESEMQRSLFMILQRSFCKVFLAFKYYLSGFFEGSCKDLYSTLEIFLNFL